MIVRSKTKVRLLILLIGLALLIGGGAAVYFVRKARIHSYYVARRAAGMEQYHKGDYASALVSLWPYIRREEFSRDAEAIYTFAEARRRVEMPNDKHLAQAMTTLQRVLSLQPDRADVKRELLELYAQLGYNIEAVELADKILAADKTDLNALRAKARGLHGRQLSEQALEVCKQANALVPLDLEIRVLSLEILRDLNQRQEMLDVGLEVLAKHPKDPRAELIMSIACSFMEQMTAAQGETVAAVIKAQYPPEAAPRAADPFHFSAVFADQASQRELNDLVLVRYLVQQLDRTRQVNRSLAVLEKADDGQAGTWVRPFLIRRLWESGRFAEALKRMEKMDTFGSTPSDIELLAMRGISQARIDQKEEAAKTANTLAGFKDDRIAQAWATIIRELILKTDSNANAKAVIESTQLALEVQRNNAYLRFFKGAAHLQLEDRDAAMEAFSQVASARPLWQLPLIYLSRLNLKAGQKRAALENASEANLINPTLASATNFLIILAANTDLSTIDTKSELYVAVTDLQTKVPGEESTLPLYVQLLAKTNQPDEAKKVVNTTLSSATPPAVSTFLRLAAVSRDAKLGLEEACFNAAEKSAGLTPQIALARATVMAEAGKTAEAASYLKDSMQKSAGEVSWRLAWATFLEERKDERAAAAWIALGDDPALAADLQVQRDALAAASVQKDAAFLSRTIERIRALSGEASVGWKLAQAKLLLRDPKAKSPELTKLLSEVIVTAPNNIEARVLLAGAYERSGDIKAAVEQITAARKLQPASRALNLDLARLYMAQLDFQRAREILQTIPPASLEPTHRRAAARLLGQQGDIGRAIEFMEGASAEAPVLDLLYLAELYRRANKHDKAEAIYKALLAKPERIEVVMAAADYYASRGQNDLSMQTLAALDQLQLNPAEKNYAVAQFSSRRGDADAALKRYQAVVQSDPTQPNGWRFLISEYIRAGRADEAVEAANKAIAALKAEFHKPFQNVIVSAATLKALAPEKTLAPLSSAVLEPTPEGDAAVEALPIIVGAIKNKETAEAVSRKLRPVADKAPRLAALQMLLVENYLLYGNAEDASAVALRSLSVSPASSEIARNAAVAVHATGRWAQALAPAQQWRELTADNPLPADLFIAELHIRLEDYASALRDLQPHIEQAKANPADKNLALVNTFRAQAMVMRGDEAAAADLLSPLLSAQPQMRSVWGDLIPFLPNPIAQKWIERLAAVTPADAVSEQIDLAIAWHGLYAGRARFAGSGDPKHKESAVAILDRLATTAPDNPYVIQARAILAHGENRPGAAEQGYRRALELKSDLPVALNNLAMMICDRGDHKEALSLAQRAVTARPGDPGIRDTLAYVQLKLKDYASAQENIKMAVRLDPKNIKWRIKLAQAYDQAGQVRDLSAILDEIEKMMADTKVTEPQRDTIRELRSKAQKTASR